MAQPVRDKTPGGVKKLMALFHERLRERGLKPAAQRDGVALIFFKLGRHISADELYVEVKKVNAYVGQATIYRTLRLLKECGMAYERYFNNRRGRYEIVADENYRLRFICDHCGGIVEFRDARLRRFRVAVAQELGVWLGGQKIELHGICPRCLRDERRHDPATRFFRRPHTKTRAPAY